MRFRAGLGLLLSLLAAACRTPDPKAELEIRDVETYWAVDPPRGGTQYIAPVIRFHLRNKSSQPTRPIQAQGDFRRAGQEQDPWPAFIQVTTARKPLQPGQEILVELKSEGHYTSPGTPEGMLENKGFRDVVARVYVRVGRSHMVRMGGDYPVERRIGAKAVREGGS